MSPTPTPEPVAPKKTIAARLQELKEIQNVCASVLSRDEAIAEFAHLLAEREKHGADTIVQPPAGGYQPNSQGISAAAREWPLRSKTPDARRKFVERSLKIANLPPEVKAAAVAAKLENRRTDLLSIAAKKGIEAQLARIEEIGDRPPPTKKSNAKARSEAESLQVTIPQSATVSIEEGLSGLMSWWEVSPADAKTRFKTFIDGANSTQAV
jgi:hypothetical protein